MCEGWQIGAELFNPDGPLSYEHINDQLPHAVAISQANATPSASTPYSQQ